VSFLGRIFPSSRTCHPAMTFLRPPFPRDSSQHGDPGQTLAHPLVVVRIAGVKLDTPAFLSEVVVDGVEVFIVHDEGHRRKSEGFVRVDGFTRTKAPSNLHPRCSSCSLHDRMRRSSVEGFSCRCEW